MLTVTGWLDLSKLFLIFAAVIIASAKMQVVLGPLPSTVISAACAEIVRAEPFSPALLFRKEQLTLLTLQFSDYSSAR